MPSNNLSSFERESQRILRLPELVLPLFSENRKCLCKLLLDVRETSKPLHRLICGLVKKRYARWDEFDSPDA